MVPNGLGYLGIGHGQQIDQFVYGIDGWVDALESLDLLPDGQRVADERLGRMGHQDRC